MLYRLYLIIPFIKDLATIVAAGVASYVALVGLHAWKKQFLGKAEHDLARRYLKEVYKIRKGVQSVRNPFIPIGEMIAALEKAGLDQKEDIHDNKKVNYAVYGQRWEEVREASLALDVELLEAEVFWGKEAVEVQKPFRKEVQKVYATVKRFLDGHGTEKTDEILYDMGENDPVNVEIEKSIQEIVKFLEPHLKIKRDPMKRI